MSTATQEDTITDVIEQLSVEMPKMWNIVFHNDDVTGFDYVMFILIKVFKKTPQQAMEFATQVHEEGKGVAGTYPHEMAEDKYQDCLDFNQANKQTLRITLEEE